MAVSNNTIRTRIQLKSDTEANWNKAGPHPGSEGFVPLLGELIVYLADDTHPAARVKIGDGTTNVVYLPFIDAGTIGGSTIPDAELRFYASKQAFPTPGDSSFLYIALDTARLYCYDSNNGNYIQLSNFTYDMTRVTTSYITNWQVGVPARVSESNGVLSIRSGQSPTLNYLNQDVVDNIIKTGG